MKLFSGVALLAILVTLGCNSDTGTTNSGGKTATNNGKGPRGGSTKFVAPKDPRKASSGGSRKGTAPRVGMMAPDLKGVDTDGKEFSLADYRGKVVMLDFWGNW